MTQELLNAIDTIKALKSDLFYQIEMKHGAEKARNYPSIAMAERVLELIDKHYIQKGDFVNNGEDYQLCDYIFQTKTDGEGFSYFEVLDFEGSYMGEIYGVELPDGEDLEGVENFETTLITWMKGEKLI